MPGAAGLAALKAERDENVQREDLPMSLLVKRARELHEEEERRAKERQREAGIANLPTVSSGKLPELSEQGDTRDKVAAAFGVSGKTYEKAKQVVDAVVGNFHNGGETSKTEAGGEAGEGETRNEN
jgi:hypothetical protein